MKEVDVTIEVDIVSRVVEVVSILERIEEIYLFDDLLVRREFLVSAFRDEIEQQTSSIPGT